MSAKLSWGIGRAARTAAVLATLAMCPPAFAQEAGAVTAVFKAKEIDFFYRSTTTFYPCHKLRNVVTNVLRAIGARDDVQVRVSDCENFASFASVYRIAANCFGSSGEPKFPCPSMSG